MNDLAQRFAENPILKPRDLSPSVEGMEVTCLLNPGVFRFQGKTWLLVRVAERPRQVPGKTSFPILSPEGRLEILEFASSDPRLDLSDPRVISFDGRDYLTTLSHLRLLSSEDGVHFSEPPGGKPLMGTGELETYGIEDCRVAKLGDTYCLTYTQVSSNGVGVGLRTTRDWTHFVHEGMIFPCLLYTSAGVVLTRTAGEGQPVVFLLLAAAGMQILKELGAFAHHAFALLKV